MNYCFDEYDLEIDGTVIKHISNGEDSVNIIQKENGDIVSDENDYIGNINDLDIDDKISFYEDEWREVNWNRSDWADWFGCDEEDVEDCMDNDMRDWD